MQAYDKDPAKAQARELYKNFLAQTILASRAPEDVKVLHFPGWADMEYLQVYKPLGIPPENVIGVEKEAEAAEHLDKHSEHPVEPMSLEQYLHENPEERFSIISLDYTAYLHEKPRLDAVQATAHKDPDDIVLHLTFQKARETTQKQDFLYFLDQVTTYREGTRFGYTGMHMPRQHLSTHRENSIRHTLEDFVHSSQPDAQVRITEKMMGTRFGPIWAEATRGEFPVKTIEEAVNTHRNLFGTMDLSMQQMYVKQRFSEFVRTIDLARDEYNLVAAHLSSVLWEICARGVEGAKCYEVKDLERYTYQSTTAPMIGGMIYAQGLKPTKGIAKAAKFTKIRSDGIDITNEKAFFRIWKKIVKSGGASTDKTYRDKPSHHFEKPKVEYEDASRENIHAAIAAGADRDELQERFGIKKMQAAGHMASYVREQREYVAQNFDTDTIQAVQELTREGFDASQIHKLTPNKELSELEMLCEVVAHPKFEV